MALELVSVSKRFGPVVVLDELHAAFAPGVTVVLGANGAGKTTLLRLLAGLIEPDAGAVRWRGGPLTAGFRRRLGYMPQRTPVYPEMTAAALLDYLAALKAIPPRLAHARRDHLLGELGLAALGRTAVGHLSGGQRQLLGLAQALLNDPDVLLLDEPFEGLDHESLHRALALLWRPGRVTVLATQRTELAVLGPGGTVRLEGGQILTEEVFPCPS